MPGVIIFDPNDDSVGFSVGDDQANAVYLKRETGTLYIADLDTIYEWEGAGTDMTATWRSGVIRLPRKVNLGAVLIEAETYANTIFKLFADIDGATTLIVSFNVTDGEPVRLPGGYLSNLFQIEIVTTDRVNSVSVAESIFDLAAG